MASFDENGKYIKTNWKAGDKITSTKLNKIEESIEAVNDNDISRHVEADARLDALEAKDVAHDKELTKIKNDIADNKAAAELGDYDINSRMTFLENELNEGIEEVHNVAETVDGKIAKAESDMTNAVNTAKDEMTTQVNAAQAEMTIQVNTAQANMTAQVNQGKADMEAMVAEVEADLDINPLFMGAVGDGLTDDSMVFNTIILSAADNSVINLHGRSYAIDSDIQLTKSLTIINGTFILNQSTIIIPAGVGHCTFENVVFNGVDKSNDGVSITYPSLDHRFMHCRFTNCNCGLKTESDRDTEQRLFVNCCTFTSNKFGIYSKDLKRHTITSNRFAGNEIGYYVYTQDYHGLGLIFNDNYLNGNKQGIHLDNGLYDSTFCGNIIDHNNEGESEYIGCGMYIENTTGRYYRNLTINGNGFRNNGDYSIIIILGGHFDYSNISNNTAHITGVKDIKIDFSNGHFSNNVLGNNNFINGAEYIDNGTSIRVNNAIFSAYQGGNIRGLATFNTGLVCNPNDNLFYGSKEGYIQYYDGTNGSMPGLRVVMPGAQESVRHKQILVADWAQTDHRPTSVPVGYMIFDTTLGKPIWMGLKSKWYDATGAEV